jgi:hypothetical protein
MIFLDGDPEADNNLNRVKRPLIILPTKNQFFLPNPYCSFLGREKHHQADQSQNQ